MEASDSRERLRSRLVLPEWLEAGLIGALTVAAVFFLRDLWQGEPLRTPALLGVMLLEAVGSSHASDAPRGAAVVYHLVHFAIWIALGLGATRLVRRAEDRSGLRWLPAAGLGLALVGLVAAELALPQTPVPRPRLWLGGLAGLLAMGAFLTRRHPGALQS